MAQLLVQPPIPHDYAGTKGRGMPQTPVAHSHVAGADQRRYTNLANPRYRVETLHSWQSRPCNSSHFESRTPRRKVLNKKNIGLPRMPKLPSFPVNPALLILLEAALSH